MFQAIFMFLHKTSLYEVISNFWGTVPSVFEVLHRHLSRFSWSLLRKKTLLEAERLELIFFPCGSVSLKNLSANVFLVGSLHKTNHKNASFWDMSGEWFPKILTFSLSLWGRFLHSCRCKHSLAHTYNAGDELDVLDVSWVFSIQFKQELNDAFFHG